MKRSTLRPSRIGVIVNPRSRRNRDRPGAAERARGIVGGLERGAEAADPEALQDAMIRFHSEGVDVVAVHGGDGTSGRIVGAATEVWATGDLPALAMLRGGTMNTVANGLDVERGRPEELLAHLASSVRGGHGVTVRRAGTMDVAGRKGFLFGTGIFASFLGEYYGRGRPHPTPLTALETFLAASGSALVRGPTVRRMMDRVRSTLTVDGERLEPHPWLFVCGGTSAELGLGFRPFSRIEEDPGRFHLIGCSTGPARFVMGLGRYYQGRGPRPGHGRQWLASECRIEAERPGFSYMVDGDLDQRTDGVLHVRSGPEVDVVVDFGRGQ